MSIQNVDNHTFLSEHSPYNPDQVVIKNKFYPQGLTEERIYDYYIQNRKYLLDWISNRNVAFFMRIDGKIVVKRKTSTGAPIRLTIDNFDELITGRTNGIYVERTNPSDYVVVDIDAGKTGISYREIHKASNVVQTLLTPMGITYWEKLFTSPNGMHVIGYLKSKHPLSYIKLRAEELLSKQENYLVNVKGRKPGTINLDLSPNYDKSLHMSRYSLTKEGLICDNILQAGRAGKRV